MQGTLCLACEVGKRRHDDACLQGPECKTAPVPGGTEAVFR